MIGGANDRPPPVFYPHGMHLIGGGGFIDLATPWGSDRWKCVQLTDHPSCFIPRNISMYIYSAHEYPCNVILSRFYKNRPLSKTVSPAPIVIRTLPANHPIRAARAPHPDLPQRLPKSKH